MDITIQTKVALKRLERLCETDPFFGPLRRLAAALELLNPTPSKRDKPTLRALLALVRNVDLFAPIPALGAEDADERLSDHALLTRRNLQAERLVPYLERLCTEQDVYLPIDARRYAVQVVNRWQPTASTPEILGHLMREYRQNHPEKFDVVCQEIEQAFAVAPTLTLDKVEEICAMLAVLDNEALPVTYCEGRQRGLFYANVGILAVRMSRLRDKAAQAGAVALFEALGARAMPIARLHVAKMWTNGWGPAGKTDFGHANKIVDALYEQVCDDGPYHPWLFDTLAGFKELLDLRITIKRELILNGRKDPKLYRERFQELAATMLLGLRFSINYFTELSELCAPSALIVSMGRSREHDDEVMSALAANPLRQIIASDTTLRDFFQNLHEWLVTNESRH